ncbi:hypothetical protein HY628_00425 [Candidatus Uhrbacteria bacterium]|nr:hypothetical protein [Candidatus Uhrbacteria bacterium]
MSDSGLTLKTWWQQWYPAHRLLALTGGFIILVVAGAFYVILPPPTAEAILPGEEVAVKKDAVFQIRFSEGIYRPSVERAFRVIPSTRGRLEWRGALLTFRPEQALLKGTTYEVLIQPSARNLWGKKLKKPFSQRFTVIDQPEVTVITPPDGHEIRPLQPITVLFDRPLRSLNEYPPLEPWLKMTPWVKGSYHWLGTSGFEFVPEEDWPKADAVQFEIPAGLRFKDQSELEEAVSWTLFTAPLFVESGPRSKDLKTHEPVVIDFNYPVQPELVRQSLLVREAPQGEAQSWSDLPSRQQLLLRVSPDDPTKIEIRKQGGWQLGKQYSFELPQNFTGGVGSRGLAAAWQQVETAGELGFQLVEKCSFTSGSTLPIWSVYGSFYLQFNNPVDEDKLRSAFRIFPEIEDLEFHQTGYLYGCEYGEGKTWQISGQWQPSTEYRLYLSGNLVDIYGQPLKGRQELKLVTSALSPSLSFAGYSQYGLLASHLPRLYQARSRNVEKPLSVEVCATTTDGYLTGQQKCIRSWQKEYDLSGSLNRYKVVDVDLDAVAGASLPNGFYLLTFTYDPSIGYYSGRTERKIVISDTALTVKKDLTGQVLVWASDLETGENVSRLPIKIYGVTGWEVGRATEIASGETNEQGIVILKLPENASDDRLAVVGQDQNRLGLAWMDWGDGIQPWNFGLGYQSDLKFGQPLGYLYTDRRIYRPDQTVFFKGVMRDDFDSTLKLPEAGEVEVIFEDPQGNQVGTQTVAISPFGTFHGQFALSPEMALGNYRFFTSPDPQFDEVEGRFEVREYRRPDFRIEINTPGQATSGQALSVDLKGEYYYGAPLSGADAQYSLSRRSLYFQPPNGEWFSFTDEENSYCYWYCSSEGNFETIRSGSGQLDAQGNLTLTLPAELTDYPSSASYSLSVTLTDLTGRSVSQQVEFPVHRGEFYVGIRPDYSAGWDAPTAEYDLVSLNPDYRPRPAAPLAIKIYKRVWSSVKKQEANGQSFWEWTKTDTLITTRSLVTDGDGKARFSFAPSTDGEYAAVVEARDSRGRRISASVSRWVDRGAGSPARVTDDPQVRIIQNKATYQVGETASLQVQTPYEHSKALVTVERGTIRSHEVIDLGATNRLISIPITGESVPNIFVSVVLVAGGGENGIPEFRAGYAQLQVSSEDKALDLTVRPDKTVYRPGETVTLKLEAKKYDGKPAEAEISVAVVDERVVALLGSIDKNMLGRFWFPRLIGVQTSQSLTRLVRKIFVETEGGGGGKGDQEGVAPVRSNFLDTAFWQADVVTDSQGKAQVSFVLPDNLTTWQILTLGVTKNTEVGGFEIRLTVRRELMIEPVIPRLLRHEDSAKISALVYNNTDLAVVGLARLNVEGVLLQDGGDRKVRLAPRSRQVVSWNVRAPLSSNQARFTFRVSGSGLEDGAEVSVPVLPYSVPEIDTTAGILQRNATETVKISEIALPNSGELTVGVAPAVGNGLQRGVEYLVDFPYGCSEQTTSAVLASLVYRELVRLQLTKEDAVLFAKSEEKVREGIKKLVSLQRPDGGWGFWMEGQESYPHLSAYVFWGLTQIERAGFSLDQGVMESAEQYLRGRLSYTPALEDRYTYGSLDLNERAQVLFMLSERRKDGLDGFAGTLYERRHELSAFAKSFLAMAYANLEGQDSRRARELLNEVRGSLILIDPNRAYISEDQGNDYFMGSDVRATSIFLQALLRIDSRSEDVERIVYYLMQRRKDGSWETTQNTAMALLALIEYVRSHPLDKTAQEVAVLLGEQPSSTLHLSEGDLSGEASTSFPLSQVAAPGHEQTVTLRKGSDRRYFYDVSLKIFKQIKDIAPFENGFTVLSDYYALDDKKMERPLTQIRQGETVRVKMKLLTSKEHRYVAWEHHLPAGLEAIDFTLNTSPRELQTDTDEWKAQQCALDWYGESYCFEEGGWEYNRWWEYVWEHREFRDDRVFLFADRLEPGVYEYEFLAQAVTPGEFRVPPSRAYEFYNPPANGHNEGKVLRILPQ